MRQSDIERFHSKYTPVTEAGCFLWMPRPLRSGYGQFYAAGKFVGAHRFAMTLHAGPIPKGMFVCHKCDTPTCVNPDHLFLGTHAENHADKTLKGRSPHGTKNGRAKLTEAEVLQVFADSRSQSAIAVAFGVSQPTVSSIKSGRVWPRVTGAAQHTPKE